MFYKIEQRHLDILRMICTRLADSGVNWVVTGSVGMALQGVDMDVHDIDLQTDEAGAYEIEGRCSEFRVEPVRYCVSERIRSHLGVLAINGINVEIIGNIQKRLDDQSWEEAVRVEDHRHWIEVNGVQCPVLSLEYEYQAYLKLGRTGKAEVLRRWLHRSEAG